MKATIIEVTGPKKLMTGRKIFMPLDRAERLGLVKSGHSRVTMDKGDFTLLTLAMADDEILIDETSNLEKALRVTTETSFALNGRKGHWEVARYTYSPTFGAIVIHHPVIFRTKESAKEYIKQAKLDLKNQT